MMSRKLSHVTRLASVAGVFVVAAGLAAPPALAQPHVSPAGNPAKCLPFPGNLQLNPSFPLPEPPPGSKTFHDPESACGYLAGSVDVRKLDATVPVGPGLSDLRVGLTTYTNFSHSYAYVQVDEPGQFEYRGLPELPPERVTFLAYGHIPVSATLHISEIGSLNLALISCTPASKCPNRPAKVALFFGRFTLRISDVDINRAPADAGPDCQTATPFDLTLTGLPPSYNVGAQYGVLTGSVTIPPFKGCSSGLDPVFTTSVSGPGNSVKVTQARICVPATGGGCPPVKPGAVPGQTGS
jgi:hypothetical protein